MIKNFALFAIITLSSISSYAVVDKALAQSAKCVYYFRYFESRLKIPKDTLYSISLQETGKFHSDKKVKMSWPWTVNIEGQGYFFDTKREAVAFVKKHLREGKESIDVGCMQVNLKHHPDAFRSVEHAFEPRINIAYGASFLRTKYEQLGNWSTAVAHYHSATPHLGEKYKNGVVKIAQNIDHYKSAFKRQREEPRIQNNNNLNKHAIYLSKAKPMRNLPSHIKERRYKSNMMIYVPNKRI